jgi:hypothetical protein
VDKLATANTSLNTTADTTANTSANTTTNTIVTTTAITTTATQGKTTANTTANTSANTTNTTNTAANTNTTANTTCSPDIQSFWFEPPLVPSLLSLLSSLLPLSYGRSSQFSACNFLTFALCRLPPNIRSLLPNNGLHKDFTLPSLPPMYPSVLHKEFPLPPFAGCREQ